MPISQRAGIPLDPDQLDHQLAIRAITARQLAAKAGLAESVLSRARHHRIREGTLKKIADALLGFPIVDGAELLIARPSTKLPDTKGSSNEEVRSDAAPVKKKRPSRAA